MTVTATLDKQNYDPDGAMLLTVSENYGSKRTLTVVDSTGLKFAKVSGSDKGQGAQFTADAGAARIGQSDVRVVLTHLSDGTTEVSAPAVYTVGPQAPQSHSVVGATLGGDDGGLDLKADARRCYTGGWVPSRATDESSIVAAVRRANPGAVIWYSYKGTGSTATLQSFVSSFNDYLAGLGMHGMVTYEHEPDIKGGIDPQVYHRGYDLLDPLCDTEPNVEAIVCLTGFSGDKDPSIWQRYWRPGHKRIGFDHYDKGMQQDGNPFDTPQENWGMLLAWSESQGKHACIGETGAATTSKAGAVIKTRAEWYKVHRDFALDPDNGLDVVCAFDSGRTPLDSATAHAWYGV